MHRAWIAAAIALAAWLGAAGDLVAANRTPERFDTVVLDAGHGGDDAGARGVRGLVEKELVLDVGRRDRKSVV